MDDECERMEGEERENHGTKGGDNKRESNGDENEATAQQTKRVHAVTVREKKMVHGCVC
jgi:hypothetical protein